MTTPTNATVGMWLIRNELLGKYSLERCGQQHPSEGDRVQVHAIILLPVSEDGYLDKRIRFGDRVQLCERALYWNWGKNLSGYREYRDWPVFIAKTWEEAWGNAEKWAQGELEKLRKALEDRAQALRDAGD